MPRLDCLSMILEPDVAEQSGIAWRVEHGVADPRNPLIESQFPWDSGELFSHGTFLRDPIDGQWKAWYVSGPAHAEPFYHWRRLTYATSDDGVRWTRPELDVCALPGHARTNVLLDFDTGGTAQHASVLVHPEADPERRYEMFVMRYPGVPEGVGATLVRGIAVETGVVRHPFAIYRYHSSDGVHWNPIEGPIVTVQLGGLNRTVLPYETPTGSGDCAWFYRQQDGTYLMYQKVSERMHPGGRVPYDISHLGSRRVIARRTSPNGSDWSPLEVILQPDWRDPQDLQFMEMNPTAIRGGYIGVVACYHALTQTIDIQLAGSIDGRIWYRPVRLPALSVASLGDYGGGMLWPTHHLVEDGDQHYLYYAATEGIHGDPFATGPTIWPFRSAICRASWRMGRYWAAVSAAGGETVGALTSQVLSAGGKRLVVNAVTRTVHEGELTAELLDPNGNAIPGFTHADYRSWRGDSGEQVVAWTGGAACPIPNASVRFHLRRARLYGFAWV